MQLVSFLGSALNVADVLSVMDYRIGKIGHICYYLAPKIEDEDNN
jgi:hypothetical protein